MTLVNEINACVKPSIIMIYGSSIFMPGKFMPYYEMTPEHTDILKGKKILLQARCGPEGG